MAHLHAQGETAGAALDPAPSGSDLRGAGSTSSPEHTAYWQRLRAADEEVQEATDLAGGFLAMVRARTGSQLATWLEQAEASGVPELRAFARTLQTDEAAVAAGLTLEGSNGQTEAQVGRLKMLKRQMNGWAGLALLRARAISATHAETGSSPATISRGASSLVLPSPRDVVEWTGA